MRDDTLIQSPSEKEKEIPKNFNKNDLVQVQDLHYQGSKQGQEPIRLTVNLFRGKIL